MREMVSSRLQTETNKRYRKDDSVTVFDDWGGRSAELGLKLELEDGV